MKKQLIIIGSRGYEHGFGGWETFVKKFVDYSNGVYDIYVPNLVENKNKIKKKDYINDGVNVHDICVSNGSLFIFLMKSLYYYCGLIKKNNMKDVTLLILGCEVGPFFRPFYKKLKKLGVTIILNPGGLIWKCDKYSEKTRNYYKTSERVHVELCDKIVCDSKAIKRYIDDEYKDLNKKTYYISYGADNKIMSMKTDEVKKLYDKYKLEEDNYYLVVCRFVPENNFETIIDEFMKSSTSRDLVIITNTSIDEKFYNELLDKYHFDKDKRIKFVGTIYDQISLKYVRENAYAYIHGHSVGGTNPSLLEALNTTKINMLYKSPYNTEVGGVACFYFTKKEDSLKNEIEVVDKLTRKEIKLREKLEKDIINKNYTWNIVVDKFKSII